MPNPSRIFVCRECKGTKPLQAYLDGHTTAPIQKVGCQDICKKPVAGLKVNGSMVWFGGLTERKQHRALGELAMAGDGEIPKVLRKAVIGKKKG